MYILGFKTGHDPAACLLEDGEIIAAAEEERFVRVKHAGGYFPEQAMRWCLSVKNLSLDNVDYIVFGREKFLKTALKVFWYFLSHFPKNRIEARFALALTKVQLKGLLTAFKGEAPYQKIFEIIGGKKRKVYSFDHHLCHAASSYYGSGFNDAALLCMDGKGEATSISLWLGKNGRVSKLKEYGIFKSLGSFYACFTELLGFCANDGEYKVMGLAPYGDPSVALDDVINIKEGRVHINSRYSIYPNAMKLLKKRFPDLIMQYDENNLPKFNADLAATLQKKLEEAALCYAREAVDLGKMDTLCLAGGVALNVKMNKVIWESGILKRLWVQPAAADMGNVLGAAWLLYFLKTGKRPKPMSHLYFGPGFSEEEILRVLSGTNLKYQKVGNIAKETAEILKGGKIVAWFQHHEEFGPRALGARSVLADPRSEKMKEIINAKVKFREPFRPFCPSFLEGHGEEIFQNYTQSPYMIMSFSVRPEWRNKIPAVCHVDGTARPQEVFFSTNPIYAELISEFYQKTGIPVLLNTSLNVKGEPIVNTPEEAVMFFKKTNVDVLAIGPYLVEK